MKINKNILSKFFYYKIRIKVFFLKLFEMFIWTINTYNLKKKIKEKKKINSFCRTYYLLNNNKS